MNDTVETSWKSGTGTSLNETVEVFQTGSGRPALSSDPVAMDSFLFPLFPFADEADNDFWPREEFVKNVGVFKFKNKNIAPITTLPTIGS